MICHQRLIAKEPPRAFLPCTCADSRAVDFNYHPRDGSKAILAWPLAGDGPTRGSVKRLSSSGLLLDRKSGQPAALSKQTTDGTDTTVQQGHCCVGAGS
jgi:hypothetical protein